MPGKINPAQGAAIERLGLWARIFNFSIIFVETLATMTTIELKNNFHLLIDSIDNESLLLKFYDLMKSRTATKEGDLLSRLTKEEQEELSSAFNESQSDENLISHEEMIKKHKKWL